MRLCYCVILVADNLLTQVVPVTTSCTFRQASKQLIDIMELTANIYDYAKHINPWSPEPSLEDQ